MVVQYKFKDLTAIGAYFDQRAELERDGAAGLNPASLKRKLRVEKAAVWESAADLMRSSELTGEPSDA